MAKADYKPPSKTYGYKRSREVPGTNPKVCRTCNLWFAARPRESVCDGCVPSTIRVKRLSLGGQSRPLPQVSRNSRSAGVYSEVLGLTFKPGVPLWKVAAFEEVQRIDRAYRVVTDTEAEDVSLTKLNATYASRAAALRQWVQEGRKVRDYPYRAEMTPREISVAIGWIPWPAGWPVQSASTELTAAA